MASSFGVRLTRRGLIYSWRTHAFSFLDSDNLQTTLCTMLVFQACLRVTNHPDLRNTKWKKLLSSKATGLDVLNVLMPLFKQPADDISGKRSLPQGLLDIVTCLCGKSLHRLNSESEFLCAFCAFVLMPTKREEGADSSTLELLRGIGPSE